MTIFEEIDWDTATNQFYNDFKTPFMMEQAEKYRKECEDNQNNRSNRLKEYNKIKHSSNCEKLTDWYIKKQLVAGGFPRGMITKELIDIKRKIIQINRVYGS